MVDQSFDLQKADSSYKGFPPFSAWMNIDFDTERWERNVLRLRELQNTPPETLEHARRIVRRYAAIETGAIEKLYEVERGFTWTIASELADVEALLNQKGMKTHGLIDSQLRAYDYLLDLATGKSEIVEAWIRELHRVLCEKQDTFLVHTNLGPQEHPLPIGRYKAQPNHVVKVDGLVHAYAPVDMVGAEMNRLIDELKSDEFVNAYPAIQAAYSHYSFVVIHPFSDGNGRVARALASIFLYKALSIPLLIMSEDRLEYLDALEASDAGNYDDFLNFTVERCFNAIDLIDLSIKAGKHQDIKKSLDHLGDFYKTKGGYSHEEVDGAANNLFESLASILNSQVESLRQNPHLANVGLERNNVRYKLLDNTYRHFVSGSGKMISIPVESKRPANAYVKADIQVHIPKDCDTNDDFVLLNTMNSEALTARITEIIPRVKPSLTVKLELFADSVMNDLMENLFRRAKEVYKK